MTSRKQWNAFIDHPVVEWTIFAVGVVLMIAAVPVGVLPGPGGIFVFAAGLAMVLKTSMWAKRHYVRFKNWHPRFGRWTDWGLRRPSARRREVIRKERQEMGSPPLDAGKDGAITTAIPGPPRSRPEMPVDPEPRD